MLNLVKHAAPLFMLKDIGVDDFSIGLARSHGRYHPELDIPKYHRWVKKYFCQYNTQNSFLKSYRETIRHYLARYNLERKYITRCYAGTLRAVMSPEGDIYPCETMGYPEGIESEKWLMGNIRDYDYNINKLLRSNRARLIQHNIRASRCHCQQGIDLSLNLMANHYFKLQITGRALYNWLSNKAGSLKR
ncbi:SPASM domain-containing protein [Fibrobacterota bacterium]